MSQLPLPNFGNAQTPFSPCGFSRWPFEVQETTHSLYERPPFFPQAFQPGFPMNSFSPYSVPQFRPQFLSPSMNPLSANHVLPRMPGPSNSVQRKQSQEYKRNFQGKSTSELTQCKQNSSSQTQFSCDACQREFTSREMFDSHIGSHVECSFEGCSFQATRKVLKLHWIQVHAQGKKRIKLDTPEEIAKWREERKRNYPTLANVEKKKEEESKRQKSGQVLKTRNFKYHRGQRMGRTFQRREYNHFHRSSLPRGNNTKEQNGNNSADSCPATGGKEDNKHIMQNKQDIMEDPLSFVLEGQDSVSGDEHEEKMLTGERSHAMATEQCSAPTALNSLCLAYASESDVEGETQEVNNNEQEELVLVDSASKTLEKGSSAKNHKTEHRRKRRQVRSRRTKEKPQSNFPSIRKSTLLEKLLAPEIRHERNVILQCLRHIVKSNFFEAEDNQHLFVFTD